MLRHLSTLVVLALAAGPLLAHGGNYKGPADAAGASAVGGGTVAPPTNPGGAAAPGPGAAAAGGAQSGGAVTAGGRTARGASDRGGSTTGASRTQPTKTFEIWEFWWENNKDRFLNLKERLNKDLTLSGSAGALTGRGRRFQQGSSRRPTRAMIETEIIPLLMQLVRTEKDRDILDSSILALGRTSEETTADQIVELALPLLAHNELSVQSSTALALGVLGSPRAAKALQDILQDNSAGRQLVGGSKPQDLVRAFAGLSLGLIGDEQSVKVLNDAVKRLPDTDKDVKVCSIVGLGLVDDEMARSLGVASTLLELLGDRQLDPLIKSYVPTSLGKIGASEALPAILDAFSNRDTDNLVQQSCAVALGMLATIEDDKAVDALLDYIAEGRDQQTRHFSIISLAEIGSRDESPDRSDAVKKRHTQIASRLRDEIQGKGKSKDHRSWGAIAGALYARGQEHAQPDFISYIQAGYRKESDPSFKSAYAVALGLLNDRSSAEMIFEDFNKRSEIDFRGYAAVALGFLQHNDAADGMRSLCQNKGTTPTLRLQAATGLGLMSDTQAVPTLIETMKSAKTLGVSSAVAKALGLIGDQESITPLKDMANDSSIQEITRAFACVALGILGEKTDLPWNAEISANNNYRAQVPSMQEVLDIL